jgi:type VI secretion system protein ImpB
MVVGDFTGREDDRPVEDRDLVSVNKDNFEEVVKSRNLALDIAADNKLDDSPEAGQMSVSLKFESLKDFEPERVAQQVPELRTLTELRTALVALKGPLGNVPSFRKAIQNLLEDEATRQRLLSELTEKSESPKSE